MKYNSDITFPKARKAGSIFRLSQPFEFVVKSTTVVCEGGDRLVCFSA
jgi:hypothetical protein